MIKRYIKALINDDQLTGGQLVVTTLLIFLCSAVIYVALDNFFKP